jgi:hypothetical protein
MRCTVCGQPLFLDEARRRTCGLCFRRAVLRLDLLLALAALAARPPRGPVTWHER